MKKIMDMPRMLQPWGCDDLIRLGKDNDGGYLVNKRDALGSSVLLSLGIGSDTSFEHDFRKLNNRAPILTYDKSVKETDINLPADAYHKEKNVIEDVPFDDMLSFAINGDEMAQIFLKCDIDGVEFGMFDHLIINAAKFSGIAIEIHNLTKQQYSQELLDFVTKLPMKLIHVHVNNYAYWTDNIMYQPDVLELTFTKASNVILDRNLELPHKLDMPNNPDGYVFKTIFR